MDDISLVISILYNFGFLFSVKQKNECYLPQSWVVRMKWVRTCKSLKIFLVHRSHWVNVNTHYEVHCTNLRTGNSLCYTHFSLILYIASICWRKATFQSQNTRRYVAKLLVADVCPGRTAVCGIINNTIHVFLTEFL